MKRIISSLCFILLMVGALQASHYLGGYIHYQSGEVYLHLYYDCQGAPPLSTATVDAYAACTPGAAFQLSLPLFSNTEITPSSCNASSTSNCNGGTSPGVREVVYKGPMITSTCAKWVFSYTECCRGFAINNGGMGQSAYLQTDTVDVLNPMEISPKLLGPNKPIIFVCNQPDTLSFSQAFNALAGDSLVYELTAPQQGSSNPIAYNLGYSPTSPMGSGWNVSIDAFTGRLNLQSVSNPSVGAYLIGIGVKRYRNGQYLGRTLYEQQISVVNCATNAYHCCHHDFEYTLNGNVANFMPIQYGSVAGTQYSWSFGDGNTSVTGSAVPVTHTYTQTGNFEVVLYVIAPNCTSNTAYLVNVSYVPAPNCNASFSYTQSGGLPDTVDFVFNGTANANANYAWDFGNGNTSTSQNPTAVYSTQGLYNACLYLNDNGCLDTFCTSLNVGVGVDLDGYIYTGSTTSDSFLVYLIEYDNAGGGTLTAIDSQFVAGAPAYYNFGNVSPAIYYTKAALLPSSPNYWSYIPTYHDSSMFWAGAAAINFISVPPLSPNGDIYMVQGTNPGGPGFIGGLISQGANRIAAGAAANIEVLLLGANDQPVAYAYTDANGAYAFNNIPLGSYKVYPEIMNKLTIPYLTTIDALNSSLMNADFLISHDSVYPASVNPIYNPALLAGFGKVYPNPTKDKLYVEFGLQQSATLDFELTDMLGRVVWSQQAKFGQGKQQIEMDMKALQAGVYILNVRENENLRLVTKVMKE